MMKTINRDSQHIGQLVVVNRLDETEVYTIAGFDGNNVLLQWREGSTQTRCTHDRDRLWYPTLRQIENSIQFNPLVSLADVQKWDKENR